MLEARSFGFDCGKPVASTPEKFLALNDAAQAMHESVFYRCRNLDNNPQLREARREEIKSIINPFLQKKDDLLKTTPDDGIHFFSFPDITSEEQHMYKALSLDDISDFTYFWVNENLGQQLQKNHFSPRIVGAFLQTLTQQQEANVAAALSGQLLDSQDTELLPKLIRRGELAGAIDPNFHRFDMQSYAALILGDSKDKQELNAITREAQTRASLSLFRYGIKTRPLVEIFNHMRYDIFLNEFDETHIPALTEAKKCPKYIDPLLGDNTEFFIKIALIGAQIRTSGEPDEHSIEELLGNERYANATQARLHYFYASRDKQEIKNRLIAKVMEKDFSSGWTGEVMRELIVNKIPINPQSSIVEKFVANGVTANQTVNLMKTALDLHEGNWDAADPLLMSLFTSGLQRGEISDNALGPLIASCIAFSIDLPSPLQPYVVAPEQHNVLSSFPQYLQYRRETGKFQPIKYPQDPGYAFLSRGFDALPQIVTDILRQPVDGFDYNAFAKGVVAQLFDKAYFQYYFGGVYIPHDYPQPAVTPLDVKGEIWKIVHPDVWSMLSKADPATLKAHIEEKVPFGKVRIEFHDLQTARVGYRETPIVECLPPSIIDRLGDLSYLSRPPEKHKPLRNRLQWTMHENEDKREKIAIERRVNSTDFVRSQLLPWCQKRGIDILTQVRLIHRAHMKGNEHVLLTGGQANNLLDTEYSHIDRIGGVVRSSEGLKMNIGLSGSLALCTSYENTPKLMERLAHTMETLFPKDSINPTVNEETIYYYASMFQTLIALIHPFYEANGRTSEDSMYILWQRRPDLAYTLRYISTDGTRTGEKVDERGAIINSFALGVVKTIGHQLGVSDKELEKVNSYSGLVKLLKGKYKFRDPVIDYLELYDRITARCIDDLNDIDFLTSYPPVIELAKQLESGSPTYTLKAA